MAELGEDYIQRTRAYRHLGRPHFTDKRPGNFMNTGLIELTLPNAKIVDVRRHPLACCVSNFRMVLLEQPTASGMTGALAGQGLPTADRGVDIDRVEF